MTVDGGTLKKLPSFLEDCTFIPTGGKCDIKQACNFASRKMRFSTDDELLTQIASQSLWISIGMARQQAVRVGKSPVARA